MRVVLAFLVAALILASSANVMADGNGLTSQFIPPAIPRSADGVVSDFSISFTNSTSQPITLTSITLNGCVNVANYPSESGSGTAITNCTQPMLNVPTCIAPGKGFTFTGAPFDQYGAVPSFSTFNATQRPATRADGGAECAAWFYQQSASTSSPSPQSTFNSVITFAPSPSASTPSGAKSATPLPGANAAAAGAAVSNAMTQALANIQAGDKTAATDAFTQMMASAPRMSTGSVAAVGAAAGIVDIFNIFSSMPSVDGRAAYDDSAYKEHEAEVESPLSEAETKLDGVVHGTMGPAALPNLPWIIPDDQVGMRYDSTLADYKEHLSFAQRLLPHLSQGSYFSPGAWSGPMVGCIHEDALIALDRHLDVDLKSEDQDARKFMIIEEKPLPSDDVLSTIVIADTLGRGVAECAKDFTGDARAFREFAALHYFALASFASRYVGAGESARRAVESYRTVFSDLQADLSISESLKAEALKHSAENICYNISPEMGRWFDDYGHIYSWDAWHAICTDNGLKIQ